MQRLSQPLLWQQAFADILQVQQSFEMTILDYQTAAAAPTTATATAAAAAATAVVADPAGGPRAPHFPSSSGSTDRIGSPTVLVGLVIIYSSSSARGRAPFLGGGGASCNMRYSESLQGTDRSQVHALSTSSEHLEISTRELEAPQKPWLGLPERLPSQLASWLCLWLCA